MGAESGVVGKPILGTKDLVISGRFFRDMEGSARGRKLSFNVTIEYLWDLYLQQARKCVLTGLPIHMRSHGKKGTASLDRVNSDLPYQEGNVQWVHKAVNMMKGSLDQQVFIALCGAVIKHRRDDRLSSNLLEELC